MLCRYCGLKYCYIVLYKYCLCTCFGVFVLKYASLQVLFEELHLDSLYGRTLSKTQVNKVKSTSESVVSGNVVY